MLLNVYKILLQEHLNYVHQRAGSLAAPQVVAWGEVAEKAGDLMNLFHNRITVDRNQIVSSYPVLSFQINYKSKSLWFIKIKITAKHRLVNLKTQSKSR
jgi:hypothetical protein